MKRNEVNFVSTIAFVAVSMMTACSGEVLDETYVEETTEGSHWQRANINLHVDRINFDAQAGVTRSVDDGWKDGDRIYLILKDKDGNNVQAYVEYDTVTTSWGQVEYDGYKSSLTCTAPRTVEAYFFDGVTEVTTSEITFDATTGVYVSMNGIYTYPADGDLEVSISLAPLTSRIRFTGESGINFSILNGMKIYTTFSRTTGQLTDIQECFSVSVDTAGTTPYIYGVFANMEEPSLVVVNNGDRFKTAFEASTNVLQVGHSGYMAIPTVDSHRGWKQVIIPATAISFDKSRLNLRIGIVDTLDITLTPTNATSEIVWSSSNSSFVDVSETGVVTAIAIGSAIVTATVDDNPNIKATCTIEVRPTPTYSDWTSTNKAHTSTSSETYTIDATYGDVLTFDWLVSSESNYDWLIVTLDGTQILKKSGLLSGTYQHTFTTSGTHTLEVKYTKDGSGNSGSDYAKVYNIHLN